NGGDEPGAVQSGVREVPVGGTPRVAAARAGHFGTSVDEARARPSGASHGGHSRHRRALGEARRRGARNAGPVARLSLSGRAASSHFSKQLRRGCGRPGWVPVVLPHPCTPPARERTARWSEVLRHASAWSLAFV